MEQHIEIASHQVITAVPGSGKTRTVATIIHDACDQGINPSSILAVTFTREAAAELSSRVMPGVQTSTIHSLAWNIIQSVGLPLDPSEITFYDDLLEVATEIVKEEGMSNLSMLVIDEAQDLTPRQYQLLDAVAKNASSVIAVGDPMQCIFTFSGADPTLMLKFGELDDLCLTTSYRIPENIATYINRVFSTGIQPGRPGGGVIVDYCAYDQAEVNRLIRHYLPESGSAGILFRTNTEIGAYYRSVENKDDINIILPLSSFPYASLVNILIGYDRSIEPSDFQNAATLLGYNSWQFSRFCRYLSAIRSERPVTIPLIWECIKDDGNLLYTYGAEKNIVNMLEVIDIMHDQTLDISLQSVYTYLERIRKQGYTITHLFPISDEELGKLVWNRITTGVMPVVSSNAGSRITLQTVHASKGREYDTVIYTVNPRMRHDDPEETRISYVAMSRARERLAVIVPMRGYDTREDSILVRNILNAGGIV